MRYIYILWLIGVLSSCKAQTIVNSNTFNQGDNTGKYFKDLDHNLDPFTGIWEYQNGNQIFRVTLFKAERIECENGINPSSFKDEIKGHFEMIEIGQAGGQVETIIYTSQKKMGASNTDWFPVITVGESYDGVECSCVIYDNSITDIQYGFVRGLLSLKMLPNATQMEWKIRSPQGIYDTNQPTDFNVPTDIVLTKQ